MNAIRLSHEDILQLLPDRDVNAHKGDFGKVLLLCGSKGYTGAAALAALGALRSGSGLVFLGVPESIYAIEAVKLTEPIVFPLADEDGMLSEDAIWQVKQRLEDMDAVLIGPGIGRSAGTEAVTAFVLENFKGPAVLDADGINVMSAHKDILRGRSAPTVLTPHAGEYQRFFGEAPKDRIAAAAALARDCNVITVLKGHETVITDGISCYVNPTGNPGMAVGGSGDVLAGILVSLLGQGIEPIKAAACATWLHGAAGDVCAGEMGQYGMLPSDVLRVLPRLLK